VLELSPLVRVERSTNDDGALIVHAGQGSRRERLVMDDIELVSWLLSIRGPGTRPMLERDVCSRLRLAQDEAAAVVDLLVETSVLIDTRDADELRRRCGRWEEWGWRDAFDYHWACYGLNYEDESREQDVESWLSDAGQVAGQPGPYKEVTEGAPFLALVAARAGDDAALDPSVAAALLANAPVNLYTGGGIAAADLAAFLQRTFAVQREVALPLGPHVYRAWPSGGSRHPVEVYVAAREVASLDRGVYHYHPRKQGLTRLADMPADASLAASGYHKRGVETASALVYVTCRWTRYSWKYRDAREYRNVLIELGHVVQTARLMGTAAGLDVYYSPVVDSYLANTFLGLDDDCEEGVMCVLGLGRGGVT
jgi:SagB-type dehydrogenase family enzyme